MYIYICIVTYETCDFYIKHLNILGMMSNYIANHWTRELTHFLLQSFWASNTNWRSMIRWMVANSCTTLDGSNPIMG